MRYRLVVTVGLVCTLVATTAGVALAVSTRHRIATPIQMSFYDGNKDAIVVTDSSNKFQANRMGVNFAPGLARLAPRLFPKIFMVRGDAASGQLVVLGAEPGEASYSPVWHEINVTWNVTPVLLTSDTEIDAARAAGDVTITRTPLLLDAPVIAKNVTDPSTVTPPQVFKTFYDGHRDGMLATDVSTRPQAVREGINFAANLATLNPVGFSEIYIVRGTAAAGQKQILGSEPGENTYSPLWLETNIRWRTGVTPITIKSDTQIDALIAKGKVTEHGTSIVLNCPVVSTP